MSEKSPEGKRTARERLAIEREKQKARERRRRTLIVAAAVAGVLGLAAVVGVLAANSGGEEEKESAGAVVVPKGAKGADGLAIPVGEESAKSTLAIWEDFRCPACAQFEGMYRQTIHGLVDKGQLKVEYHLATIIDGNMGGTGSVRAANAAACAQDAGKFTPYHDVLYQNQPQEADDAFAKNGRLLELADKVAGLRTPAFEKCVNDGEHDSWVARSNEAFQKGGFRGTPTVHLNGKDIFGDQQNPLTPAKLKQQVEAAAK